MRVHYPKLRNNSPYFLPLNVFTASKGSNFSILFIFRIMGCRFTIYSLFMDIHNSFMDIHNSFMDIHNSFMDILNSF